MAKVSRVREKTFKGVRIALAVELEQMSESDAIRFVEQVIEQVTNMPKALDVVENGYAVQDIDRGDVYIVGEEVQRGGWYGESDEKPGKKGNFKSAEVTVETATFDEGDVI